MRATIDPEGEIKDISTKSTNFHSEADRREETVHQTKKSTGEGLRHLPQTQHIIDISRPVVDMG